MQKDYADYTADDAVSNDVLSLASSVGVSSGPSVPAPLAGAGSVGPFTFDCIKPVEVSETVPPVSDTGALYTQPLFDWLSFTFPPVVPLATVLELLAPIGCAEQGEDGLIWVLGRGANGYKAGYRRGDIAVYHDGSADMGVNVQISGQGCRQLELEQGLRDEKSWQGFARAMVERGARFRRVDVAMDDGGEDACLSMELVHQAVADDNVVSLFHTSTPVREERLGRRKPGEAFVQSDTRYFGSRKSSNMFVRIYNKHLEQLQKKGMTALDADKFCWIRCEMCARQENAEALMGMFIQHGFKVIPDVLMHYLDFKTPSETDENRSRWATAPWWAKFCDNMRGRSLGVAPGVKTLEKAAAWVRKQVATTLALMYEATDSLDDLVSIMNEGRSRYSSVHRAMLAAHKSTFGPGRGSSGDWPLSDASLGGVFGG